MSRIAALVMCCAFGMPVHASVYSSALDLSGLQSQGLDGDLFNQTTLYDAFTVLPYYVVVNIEYDITIQTVGSSWLSDLHVRFGNSSGTFVGDWPDTFVPGMGDDFSGTQRYTGSFMTNIDVSGDYEFHITLFESFDDTGLVDAYLLEGSTMTLDLVMPAPSSAMLLGLGGAFATRRRR
ncbi:MAG: hypothetical protein ACSHX5_07625 [Phycisphaerales bacterium]